MPPTIGDFGVDLIGALGGKPTKQSRRLFSSWQRWEGGWTNNAATYNPLNLTAPGSGLPTINSVGVVAMPSYQAGLKRTAKLIQTGYPAIAAALRSGRVDFSDPALQADLNRWLSGKRTPGMTPYVQKIASSFGQNLPAQAVSTPAGRPQRAAAPAPAVPQKPVFDPMSYASSVLGQYASGGSIDFTQLPGIVQSSFKAPPLPPAAPGAGSPTPKAPGAAPPIKGPGIRLPESFKSTHETSNLGWPAVDIMGKPGTPVRVPVAGTIVRHGSAQGGEALYLDTNGDGEGDYWLGHVTDMLPVGAHVQAGQVIARISPDHPRPHAHWAKR